MGLVRSTKLEKHMQYGICIDNHVQKNTFFSNFKQQLAMPMNMKFMWSLWIFQDAFSERKMKILIMDIFQKSYHQDYVIVVVISQIYNCNYNIHIIQQCIFDDIWALGQHKYSFAFEQCINNVFLCDKKKHFKLVTPSERQYQCSE